MLHVDSHDARPFQIFFDDSSQLLRGLDQNGRAAGRQQAGLGQQGLAEGPERGARVRRREGAGAVAREVGGEEG